MALKSPLQGAVIRNLFCFVYYQYWVFTVSFFVKINIFEKMGIRLRGALSIYNYKETQNLKSCVHISTNTYFMQHDFVDYIRSVFKLILISVELLQFISLPNVSTDFQEGPRPLSYLGPNLAPNNNLGALLALASLSESWKKNDLETRQVPARILSTKMLLM